MLNQKRDKQISLWRLYIEAHQNLSEINFVVKPSVLEGDGLCRLNHQFLAVAEKKESPLSILIRLILHVI